MSCSQGPAKQAGSAGSPCSPRFAERACRIVAATCRSHSDVGLSEQDFGCSNKTSCYDLVHKAHFTEGSFPDPHIGIRENMHPRNSHNM